MLKFFYCFIYLYFYILYNKYVQVVQSGRKWGITMFMGEYNHNIDEKSRLVIPSNFRFELKDTFVIAKGLEKCLYIYSNAEWQKIVSELDTLPFTKSDVRTFKRAFFSGASSVELDKSGRIIISSNLKEYANIEKECVIVGTGEKIEIWAKEEWDNFMNNYSSKISDIAEHLFESVNL